MLILGIETATEQVSVAIGGHEGVIGLFEVDARPAPRRDARAGDRVRVRARPTSASTRSAWSPSTSAPGCSPACASGWPPAKAMAQALRVPMIGISSLDLLAFPRRHTDRVVVPVIDARKGEVFYAMYRQVPGGVQQVVAAAGRPVDELVADLLARSQDVLCVGDGALRYRERDPRRLPLRDRRRRPPVGRPAGAAGPRPGAARGVGATPREIEPMYLRQPDAQINWATRASRPRGPGERASTRLLRRDGRRADERGDRADAPRATSAGVLAIERERTRGRGRTACSTTSSTRCGGGHRHYLVARRAAEVVGYAGLMFVADEAHVTNIAVHPDHRRGGDRHRRCCSALAARRDRRGCTAWTLEVRCQQHRRPGAVPRGSASCRPGIRARVLRGHARTRS